MSTSITAYLNVTLDTEGTLLVTASVSSDGEMQARAYDMLGRLIADGSWCVPCLSTAGEILTEALEQWQNEGSLGCGWTLHCLGAECLDGDCEHEPQEGAR